MHARKRTHTHNSQGLLMLDLVQELGRTQQQWPSSAKSEAPVSADIVKDYRNRVKPRTEDTCHAEFPQHTLSSMGCCTLRSQYKQGRKIFWQSHWFCKAFNKIKIQMTHIHYCPCQLFQQRKACFCWHFLQIVLNFCSSSSSIKKNPTQFVSYGGLLPFKTCIQITPLS